MIDAFKSIEQRAKQKSFIIKSITKAQLIQNNKPTKKGKDSKNEKET